MKRELKKKMEVFYSEAEPEQADDRLKIECNICDSLFHPHSTFERFCSSCRKSSRVFKMSEWLPDHVIQF